MTNVVIIDYQLGNLFSVRQALLNFGLGVTISSSKKDIENADALVLPGVGAFGDAMNNLHKFDLVSPMIDFVQAGKPFMGICLGLQLLFTESEEFGSSRGLNLIPGFVKRFSNFDIDGNNVKVPQIAWNRISPAKDWSATPLKQVPEDAYMYFVHSFFVSPEDSGVQLSITQYHHHIYTSSVLKDNIFACQFHPEKSAEPGLTIYRNWAELNHLI